MAAVSTKGLAVYMTKGSSTPTELVPTAISAAKPAVVTVASVTGVTAGDLVTLEGTNFTQLDGKTFTVGTVDSTGNTFTLIGSDTTGSTAALGTAPKAHVYTKASMVKLCLASIDISAEAGGSTPVGTFCDPSASIATPPTSAGTVSMTGYVNATDADYAELLIAEADGKSRVVEIALPQNNGSIVFPVTISSVAWQTPLEGAIGYTFSGTLGSKPVHRF